MKRELTRAEQDAILAANGVTEIAADEFVIFDGDEFTIYRMVLKDQPRNRRERRAEKAARQKTARP